MYLSHEERIRYARHLAMPDFGEEGQLRLKCGSVLVIGAGGLGSPVILYLAAAGVGKIGIVDGDLVDLTNLQRQIAHHTADVGRRKTDSAADSARAINPMVYVEKIFDFVTNDNIECIMSGYDFVIDATDRLDTKFLVDDACARVSKPYNHGAIRMYEGQTMTVLPGTSRYRDLFPEEPVVAERNAVEGPLGVVPGILGTIQASEAIKYLTGTGELLTDKLLRFDLRTMDFMTVRLA